jgi:hypothetical protein
MTRPITKRFFVRTLTRLASIARNLGCDEKIARSLVNAGLKSKRFRYLGSYLENVGYLMARFEPPTTEPRRCVVCLREAPILFEQLPAKRSPQTPRRRRNR